MTGDLFPNQSRSSDDESLISFTDGHRVRKPVSLQRVRSVRVKKVPETDPIHTTIFDPKCRGSDDVYLVFPKMVVVLCHTLETSVHPLYDVGPRGSLLWTVLRLDEHTPVDARRLVPRGRIRASHTRCLTGKDTISWFLFCFLL